MGVELRLGVGPETDAILLAVRVGGGYCSQVIKCASDDGAQIGCVCGWRV